MVLKSMRSYAAAQSGDTVVCAAGAADCEAFALAEGVTAVCAEAAFLWVCAGQLDRARALVDTFHGGVLDDLPRDVNWLLILQCVLEAALAVADREVVEDTVRLLAPYAGRPVFNAGAVMFHGVTDDTLSRAAAFLGDPERAGRFRSAALVTYERLGAQWWRDRLIAWTSPKADEALPGPQRAHLHPAPGGLWLVGPEPAVPLNALRGFSYLRELLRRPGQPLSALDLVGAGTGVAVQSGLGDLVDREGLNAYRERLRDLDGEIAEASEWSDTGRLESLQTEREALLDEIARSTGLFGRARTTGSSQERARIAAKKAISAAINRIAAVHPALAGHLQTTIHTGNQCVYLSQPDDAPIWILD
jgi:hypothetical protein